MKELIFLLILISTTQFISAQDTSVVNYFPMSIGNTWVYSCGAFGNGCSCTQRRKLQITGTILRNGKTYYIFQNIVRNLSCIVGGCATFTIPIDTIRIDPISGNIMRPSQPGCSYSPNESMEDSLRLRYHDTLKVDCGSNRGAACTDTNSVVLFGTTCSKRTHNLNFVDSYFTMSYARGFGINNAGFGGSACTSNMNLIGCILNGALYGDTNMLVGINQISNEVPGEYFLHQNYPNPFNPTTSIKFDIPKAGIVSFKIFDILGKEVYSVNKFKSAGQFEFTFDASNYASGLYYYKLESDGFTETKKMVLLK